MEKKTWRLRMAAVGLAGAMLLLSATVSPGQSWVSQHGSPVKEKNPNTALWWSLAGTAIPIAASVTGAAAAAHVGSIGFFGLLIGPSLGYFYGGLPWRGLLGVGLRAIGAAVLIQSFFMAWDESWGWSGGENWDLVALAGGVILFGSATWDLVSVKGAVKERNLKMRDKTLAFAPLLNLRTRSVGVMVRLSF